MAHQYWRWLTGHKRKVGEEMGEEMHVLLDLGYTSFVIIPGIIFFIARHSRERKLKDTRALLARSVGQAAPAGRLIESSPAPAQSATRVGREDRAWPGSVLAYFDGQQGPDKQDTPPHSVADGVLVGNIGGLMVAYVTVDAVGAPGTMPALVEAMMPEETLHLAVEAITTDARRLASRLQDSGCLVEVYGIASKEYLKGSAHGDETTSQPPPTPVCAAASSPLAPRQAARSGQAASPGRGRASLLGLTIDPAGRAIAIASSSGVARAEIDRLWNEDVRSNDKQGKWETIYAPEEAGRITAAALVDRDSIVVATGSGELCLKTHDGELRQVFRLEEGEGREQVIDSVLFDPGRKSVIFATGGSVYECLVDGEEASEILEGAAWVEDMALSPGDDLLVANVAGVWELDQDGAVVQVAGTLKFGPCQGLVADRAGDLYVSVAAKRNIVRVSGGRVSRDGFRSGEIVWPPERYGQHVSLVNPGKLALDERGRLYCLDQDIDALVAMDMETR